MTQEVLGDKDHFINLMLSNEKLSEKDEKGNYIVDTNPNVFNKLVSFMTSKNKQSYIVNAINVSKDIHLLRQMADFLCMKNLCDE